MPLDAFTLKIQRELSHPKCARRVSGLPRNGLLVRVSISSPLVEGTRTLAARLCRSWTFPNTSSRKGCSLVYVLCIHQCKWSFVPYSHILSLCCYLFALPSLHFNISFENNLSFQSDYVFTRVFTYRQIEKGNIQTGVMTRSCTTDLGFVGRHLFNCAVFLCHYYHK